MESEEPEVPELEPEVPEESEVPELESAEEESEVPELESEVPELESAEEESAEEDFEEERIMKLLMEYFGVVVVDLEPIYSLLYVARLLHTEMMIEKEPEMEMQ